MECVVANLIERSEVVNQLCLEACLGAQPNHLSDGVRPGVRRPCPSGSRPPNTCGAKAPRCRVRRSDHLSAARVDRASMPSGKLIGVVLELEDV